MIRVDKQVNQSCKREFSDGPLIRTPSFPWGRRFHPGWGTQIQQATQQKKQKKNVSEYKISIPTSALFLCNNSKQTEN